MGIGAGWLIISLALVVVVALLALVVALIARASNAPAMQLDEADNARLQRWLSLLRVRQAGALGPACSRCWWSRWAG